MYKDNRVTNLAKMLLDHSVDLQANERLMIITSIVAKPLVKEIIKYAYEKGAYPTVNWYDAEVNALGLEHKTEKQIEFEGKETLELWKKYDATIQIVANENDYSNINIPTKNMQLFAKNARPRMDYMIKNIKWSLLNYPTDAAAQKAKMTTDDFADYVFSVSTIDYKKMSKAMDPLVQLMQKTDKVRIVSPGTDLTFSIKDIDVVKCAGNYNVPDGEVFTAPVKTSVNGVIKYNTPCPYMGNVYEDVELHFENGKIVKAMAKNDVESLNAVFNTDEGAKYVGEFAIGIHPLISHPMGDILFDEKIHGSIHFTPGNSYDDASNGNNSAIHWDMVLIQRKEYGGGELYFDDVLIRKDGIFVLPELTGLNPDELIK